jgi:type IV secretory pathway VirB10-like protein
MHRGDTDAGGAADLQTDIMRFMAILALCLVAIFALVQSIPLVPEAPSQSPAAAAPPPVARVVEPQPAPHPAPQPAPQPAPEPEPVPQTRPETAQPVPPARPQPMPAAAPERPAAPPAEIERDEGFTLRFESDLALTRLVAAGKVGLYAMTDGRARRMTVRASRISFWDASAPNRYHEMEAGTVPRPVVDALSRTGVNTSNVGWGVTLPGALEKQLDSLMRGSSGGALVIGGDGELRLEAS